MTIINPTRSGVVRPTEILDDFRRLSVALGGGQSPKVLTTSHKTELARDGYSQMVSYLLPHSEGVKYARRFADVLVEFDIHPDDFGNLCRNSTKGCRWSCLNNSGRLAMDTCSIAAFVRTVLWNTDLRDFEIIADYETQLHKRRCEKNDDVPVVRIGGTHDPCVERDLPMLVEFNPDVIFVDYSKRDDVEYGWVRDNVYRVHSASEKTTIPQMWEWLSRGENVAVPFIGKTLPETYFGMHVVDGDRDDLRFLDPEGVIVGLRHKPAAHRPVEGSNGFIRPVPVDLKVK